MTTTQRLALWASTAVAGVSGLAYAAMKYLLPRNDPFSAYGHPLQPYALKLHVLAVPLLVFVVGWLYGAHAQQQLRGGGVPGRGSGRAILALTVVLVLSGTLVQAFADAAWRPAAGWVHGITGTAFVAALAAHALAGRRRRAAVAGTPPAPPRRPAYLRPITFPRSPAESPAAPGRSGHAPAPSGAPATAVANPAPTSTRAAAGPAEAAGSRSWRALRGPRRSTRSDLTRELIATRAKFASPGTRR